MGLPGSGKTTLANELAPMLKAKRLNADEVRKKANDWDFSEEGRKKQAERMAKLAEEIKLAILKRAVQIDKKITEKKVKEFKKKFPDYKTTGNQSAN